MGSLNNKPTNGDPAPGLKVAPFWSTLWNGLVMSNDNEWDAQAFWHSLSRVVDVREWTWKRVSRATGVSSRTLVRLKAGRRPDAASLSALSAWSGLSPADFVRPEPVTPRVRFCPDALSKAMHNMATVNTRGDN